SSVTQSRLGLIMNGLVKIPMQFLILLIGTLVFSFYQFYQPPVFFNRAEIVKIENSPYKDQYRQLEAEYTTAHAEKLNRVNELVEALHSEDEAQVDESRVKLQEAGSKSDAIKKDVAALMTKNNPRADTNDSNYVFLSFVTQQLPVGIVGLLVAIIFLAAMGSSASGLNSLASTTVVDFYQRMGKQEQESHAKELAVSRWATIAWGVFCIVVALYASKLGNLLEAVNILGSLFYGTILGVFLVAFYMKKVNGTNVFVAALIAEVFVMYCWYIDLTAFLWLNVSGCLMVMILSWLLQTFRGKQVSE
ncbi:MAG: sodium:solute symporter, partial [Bacteroidota bacterium]